MEIVTCGCDITGFSHLYAEYLSPNEKKVIYQAYSHHEKTYVKLY